VQSSLIFPLFYFIFIAACIVANQDILDEIISNTWSNKTKGKPLRIAKQACQQPFPEQIPTPNCLNQTL